MDRVKVINGLRCIKGDTILCRECGYSDVDGYGNYSCKINCAIDTLELLKEQEDLGTELTNAVELIHKKNARIEKLLKEQEAVSITTDYFDGFGNRTSHCPSCNSRLVWHQNKNYCGECGQAVKWE